MAFDSLVNYCGERQEYPKYKTSPGGGCTVYRSLDVLAADVNDWIVYFTTNPIDPYTMNGNCWEIVVHPFDKEQITAASIYVPGVASYQLAVINITYESVGMRWYPGLGVVKEEISPRAERIGVGGTQGSEDEDNLVWATADSNGSKALFHGEDPDFTLGGAEVKVTFPFAPTGSQPFAPGSVNDAPVTMLVSGNTFDTGCLKYIGPEIEASVVIPAVGIYTGLVRYKKSFVFHYRSHDWNEYWRARDSSWHKMEDQDGNTYEQYTPTTFTPLSWFV